MENFGKDRLDTARQYDDTGSMPAEPETNEAGEEIPTEEEQLDYDLLTVRARKMIFGKGKEKVLTMLGTSDIPAKGMGQVASMIIKSLMTSAKQSGREIDGNTAIHAGAEVIEDLSSLAKSAGVFEYDSPEEEKKQMEDAMLWGVKFYGDGAVASGEITPEWQAMAKKQVQQGLQQDIAANPPKQKDDKVKAAVQQGLAQAPGAGIIGGSMPGGM